MEINKVIQGNCLDYLEMIPKDAFIISDPPYNQKYHYDNYSDNLEIQEYRDLLFKVFAGRKSVIIHYPEETINILATLNLGKCEDVVSWIYNSNTAKQHRLITWWNCFPSMQNIPQNYKNPDDKRIRQRILSGKTCRGYDWWLINQVKNVSKGKDNHSCPIPESLANKIILSTTQKSDLIVDPFCGSGTILKVAKELGRKFIGIELSKKYCDMANDRLRACNTLF